jgi:hypothetical protein
VVIRQLREVTPAFKQRRCQRGSPARVCRAVAASS